MHLRRRFSSLSAVAGCVAVVLAQAVAAQDKNAVRYNIPAQSLESALSQFAIQSKRQVIYDPGIVPSRETPGLKGEYVPETALQMLLKDSGLQVRITRGDTIVVTAEDRAATSGTSADRRLRLAQADTAAGSQGPVAASESSQKRIELEEVVVTGTHIRGATDSASPIQIYTRDDIDRSGLGSVQEFIERLPQNFNGGASEDTLGGLVGGAFQVVGGSSVNLRGLGSDSTLTLVNGRRLAPAGERGDFVDISLIPLNAVERIEILMDGASAIYGSDAVGGVVNFILRRDFDKPETRARYGSVTSGDSHEIQLGQTAGLNWSGGSALLSYEYHDRTPLDFSDRAQPVVGSMDRVGGRVSLLPKQERHGALLTAHHRTSHGLELFADGTYSHRSHQRDFERVFRSATDFNDIDAYTASAGARKDLSERVGVELSSSYARSKTHAQAYAHPTRANNFIGGLTRDKDMDLSVFSADSLLHGSLWTTRAGAIQFALGAQYRQEEFDRGNRLVASDAFQNDRNLLAGFAELRLPLLGPGGATPSGSRLEVVLADRFERYSDFGSTNNPKFGVIWRPSSSLKFRGTYGTSFKAPLLENLDDQPLGIGAMGLPDPATTCGCGITDAIQIFGGNPDLVPEEARTWTFGVDLQPHSVPGLRASITYYDVRYEDRIVNPQQSVEPFDALVREGILGPTIVQRNPSPSLVQQLTTDPVFEDFRPFTGSSGLGFGAIVDFRLHNLSAVDTSGVDLALAYTTSSALGEVEVGIDGTYILEFDNQFSSTAPPSEILNTPYNPIDLRLRGHATLRRGGFTVALFMNYTDSYTDNRVFVVGTTPRSVGSWTTLDATVGYKFGSNRGFLGDMSAMLGVINLADKDPPFLENRFFPIHYDGANANILGRFVSLQLAKSWGR